MSRPHRLFTLRRILLLLVLAVLAMGSDCDGCDPAAPSVSQVPAAQCKNQSDLGSGITSDSTCASEAASRGCANWAWVASECTCCR
jgi:hypothetical protein